MDINLLNAAALTVPAGFAMATLLSLRPVRSLSEEEIQRAVSDLPVEYHQVALREAERRKRMIVLDKNQMRSIVNGVSARTAGRRASSTVRKNP